jgi:hypothetical protein
MKVTCDWEKEMMGSGSWWYVRANKKYCVVRLMGLEYTESGDDIGVYFN